MAAGGGLLLVGAWALALRPPTILERIRPRPVSPSSGADRPSLLTRQDALGAAAGAVLLGVIGLLVGGASAGLVLALAGGAGGWWVSGWHRRRRGRARLQAMEACVPAFAELLALAASAGAGLPVAIERCAEHVPSPLGAELGRAAADLRAGASVESAVADLDVRVGSASMSRVLDSLLVARERGTPVADVLRAQALDVRSDHARRLMEAAARKDVAMLVPIVFLVLPVVVLVALYPGVVALRSIAP
jgi:tight adherence protein C